jgi:hypothetical protein
MHWIMSGFLSLTLTCCCTYALGGLEVQTSVYYRIANSRSLVKRLPPSCALQGQAITRDGNVVLAYEGGDSEPTTLLSLYDVKRKRERVLVEIFTTPDLSFSYDKATDLVVFNWAGEHGIYVFSLDAARKIPLRLEALPEFKKLIVHVAKCDYCYEPRWTKDHRIAYLEWGDHGPLGTKYLDLPPEVGVQAPVK